jgi:beta-galactosidase
VQLANPNHPGASVTTPGTVGTADTWAEQLATDSPATEINTVYSDPQGWLDGKPAVVSRKIGEGNIGYLGTLPDARFLRSFLLLASPYVSMKATFSDRAGVELCTRFGPSGAVAIYINHGAETASISLQHPMRNLLSPSAVPSSELTLPPQGVAVLVPESAQ